MTLLVFRIARLLPSRAYLLTFRWLLLRDSRRRHERDGFLIGCTKKHQAWRVKRYVLTGDVRNEITYRLRRHWLFIPWEEWLCQCLFVSRFGLEWSMRAEKCKFRWDVIDGFILWFDTQHEITFSGFRVRLLHSDRGVMYPSALKHVFSVIPVAIKMWNRMQSLRQWPTVKLADMHLCSTECEPDWCSWRCFKSSLAA